jgi:hypothetical protein
MMLCGGEASKGAAGAKASHKVGIPMKPPLSPSIFEEKERKKCEDEEEGKKKRRAPGLASPCYTFRYIHYVSMHNNIYKCRKLKMIYNLQWMK